MNIIKLRTRENLNSNKIERILKPFDDQLDICDSSLKQIELKTLNGGKISKKELSSYINSLGILTEISNDATQKAIVEGLIRMES